MKSDLLANFLSRGWIALLSIIAIPLYVRYLGIESYGLIGFFATIQGLISMFDMGLSTTINREFAVMSARQDESQNMRDLLKTLQSIYVGVGLGIGVLIVLLSPLIARYWVKGISLPQITVVRSVTLMGIALLVQWPINFYTNGLMGLDRQVISNGLNAIFGTLRTLGTLLILAKVSTSISAYFGWQALVAFANSAVTAVVLWRQLPRTGQPSQFRLELLKPVWRYSAGLTGIAITAVLWSQSDKIVLSKLISLEDFGYYMLAFSVAVAINNLSYPVYTMMFPKLARESAKSIDDNFKKLYHTGCQILAVSMFPMGLLISIFPQSMMWVWTGDGDTAERTYTIVRLLSLCSVFGGSLLIPQALQLCYKWTNLTFYTNLISTGCMVVVIFIFVPRHGVLAAASGLVVITAVVLFYNSYQIHKRLLKGEWSRWLINDVGKPVLVSSAIMILGNALFDMSGSRIFVFCKLFGIWLVAALGTSLAVPMIRLKVLKIVKYSIGSGSIS